MGGTDIRFFRLQANTSLLCETTDTKLVHRAAKWHKDKPN